MPTHYEQHLKPIVDADPAVIAAKAKADKAFEEFAAAQRHLINIKNQVIARVQQCADTQQSGS